MRIPGLRLFTAETLSALRSRRGSSLRSNLCVLCVSAVIGLCSCALSADRGSAPQQETSSIAPQKPAVPTSKKQPAPVDANKFALVVAGVGGEEAYTRKFTSQATRLYEVLTTELGFAVSNVTLLTEAAPGAGPEEGARESDAAPARRATADEVRKAFASFKSAGNSESLVLVVLIGHGSFDNQQAKFNLIGPDLAAKDYAQLIGTLPNKRVVFVDCSSSSGEFVKPLSGEGRIVLTATRSGNEQNATVFADHFIAGLEQGAADADKNGRVSVLEAFNYATKLTADWYKEKNRLATEHALIDDNADGAGHEEATGGDGVVAKLVYLDSKNIMDAAGDAELGRLIKERQRYEEEVEKLKARKGEMKQEDYEAELERLLVELAKVNQQIKGKQK